MLKLGAETEITWGLSSVDVNILAAKSNSRGLRCLCHTKSLNVFITKCIQTMHIHNINLRSSDMIKFNYRSFNFF